MAEFKKSFVLYADLIHTVQKMPKDNQADLFMSILRYVNDEKFTVDSFVVELVFEPIKQQLKRDLVKWEGICQRRSIAGIKGGLKSGETRKNKANEASASFASQEKTREANEADNDNVNDNDNDNVNDNDIISKEIKEKLKNESFLMDLINSELWVESIFRQNKIIPSEKAKTKLNNWLNDFNIKLSAECDSKISKQDYGAHFSRWLVGEIAKEKTNKEKEGKTNQLNTNPNNCF
jgi:hypothetical protein